MEARDLVAILNSALYRDYFARRFLKERDRVSIGAHASRII